MKKIIILGLICYLPLAMAEKSLMPLDMELGHWVTKTTIDHSAMMDKLLASVPKAQHAMMKEMMKSKMQDIEDVGQCITAESLENFEQQFKDALGQDGAKKCEFNVISSTGKKFEGNLVCSKHTMNIVTNALSTKHQESTVVSDIPGIGEQRITSVAKWQSATCPKGI